MAWPGRKRPYTEIGVARIGCVRCGAPAATQWQVCADRNTFRPLCIACDIALNRLVLEWAGHPDVDELMASYELAMLGPG